MAIQQKAGTAAFLLLRSRFSRCNQGTYIEAVFLFRAERSIVFINNDIDDRCHFIRCVTVHMRLIGQKGNGIPRQYFILLSADEQFQRTAEYNQIFLCAGSVRLRAVGSLGSLILETPPAALISAGILSSAITAHAPADRKSVV